MTNRLIGKSSNLAFIIVFSTTFFLAVVFGHFSRSALALELDTQLKEVIHQLTRRTSPDQQMVTAALKTRGFPPEDWNDWRKFDQWPIPRQLEAAWLGAQSAEGRGNELLGQIIMELIESNEAIGKDAPIQSFLEQSKPAANPKAFVFTAVLNAEAVAEKIPTEVKVVVKVVARHVDFPPIRILLRCCGLAEERVYEILRRASSVEEALEMAVREGGVPPKLANRAARLMGELINGDISLAFEESLSAYRDDLILLGQDMPDDSYERISNILQKEIDGAHAASVNLEKKVKQIALELPKIESADKDAGQALDNVLTTVRNADDGSMGIPSGGINPGGGSGGGGSAFDRANYHAFQTQTFSSVKPPGGVRATAFSSMRVMRGGFGGVVLGNKVEGPTTPVVPLVVTWTFLSTGNQSSPNPNDPVVFIVVTRDGQKLHTMPLLADEAKAIIRLIFTGTASVEEVIKKDEGIGLAGIANRYRGYRVEGGQVVSSGSDSMTAPVASFYVHPAIADTSVGRSAMLADAYPFFFVEQLRNLVSKRLQGNDLKFINQWIQENKGFYKFIDQVTQIRVSKNFIFAVPVTLPQLNESDVELVKKVRATNVLTLQAFVNEEPVEDKERLNVWALSLLVSSSNDYARLNRFAAVLAVVRWARDNDAVFVGEQPPLGGQTTVSTLIKLDGSIMAGPSPVALAQTIVDEIAGQAEAVRTKYGLPPVIAEFDKKAFETRSRAVAAYGISSVLDHFNFTVPKTGSPETLENFTADNNARYQVDDEISKKTIEIQNLNKLFQRNLRELASLEERYNSLTEKNDSGDTGIFGGLSLQEATEFVRLPAKISKLQKELSDQASTGMQVDREISRLEKSYEELEKSVFRNSAIPSLAYPIRLSIEQSRASDIGQKSAEEVLELSLGDASVEKRNTEFFDNLGELNAKINESRKPIARLRELLNGARPSMEETYAQAGQSIQKTNEGLWNEYKKAIAFPDSWDLWWIEWRLYFALPSFNLYQIQLAVEEAENRIKEIDDEMEQLKSGRVAYVLPGLNEWHSLHRSYVSSCPTIVCISRCNELGCE